MRTAPRHRSQRGEHGGHPSRWTVALAVAVILVIGGSWMTSSWPASDRLHTSERVRSASSGTTPSAADGAQSPTVPTAQAPAAEPEGTPQALDVPALHLHADVVPIDLTGNTLTPPADPRVVGWWRQGAPGASTAGTVVLTGHTVHTGGGAMDDLEQVIPGDLIILRVHGAPVNYQVDRVEVISKAALANRAETLFGQRGTPRVVLVTCENWNGHEYQSNVVVTATPSA